MISNIDPYMAREMIAHRMGCSESEARKAMLVAFQGNNFRTEFHWNGKAIRIQFDPSTDTYGYTPIESFAPVA